MLVAVVRSCLPAAAGSTPADTVAANLRSYSVSALQASRAGAQIVVFPEFGLLASNVTDGCHTPADMAPWCEPVPEVGDSRGVPCDNPTKYTASPSTVAASCMAKNASIIVSVNLCRSVGAKNFNTQVVLSETGAVRFPPRYCIHAATWVPRSSPASAAPLS